MVSPMRWGSPRPSVSVMTTVNENATDTTEEFAERVVGAIDSASLAMLLSIGHQTKLFDTMAELPPATSAQIADAAGLSERYVREWLGGVVTCRVVDYDPAAQRYSLPRSSASPCSEWKYRRLIRRLPRDPGQCPAPHDRRASPSRRSRRRREAAL